MSIRAGQLDFRSRIHAFREGADYSMCGLVPWSSCEPDEDDSEITCAHCAWRYYGEYTPFPAPSTA